MDITSFGEKLKGWIIRFRYPILVLAAGVVLLTVPGKVKTSQTQDTPTTQVMSNSDLSAELTEILRQISGVGEVKVLLTVSKGEKIEYQQDEDQQSSESSVSIRKETIIIKDANDNESALIIQVIPPQYLGAVVVCEGADNANVKLAVVEAVSKATGLRSDSISVLKMK